MNLNEIKKHLNPTDYIVIIFYILLTIINLVFYKKLEYPLLFILINFVVISYAVTVSYYEGTKQSKLFKAMHYWYLPPLILLSFKELYFMIRPIREVDYDYLLIEMDRFIFGTDPTKALLTIANPILTEILQIAYMSFFFLPVFLALSLYLQKRKLECDYSVFAVIYGFFLSYIGYFMLPGVGPRFTVHEFANLDAELPGLILTPIIRGIINAGGSVFPWTDDPTRFVQRDVFPSGHTMMTLIVMYLSVKFKSRNRVFLLIIGTLLIISTVYLRYHYVVDLIAGFIFMVISLWSGKKLFNYLQKKTNSPEISY